MAGFVKELHFSGAVLLLTHFCCSASGQLPPETFTIQADPAKLTELARGSNALLTCKLSVGRKVEYSGKYEMQLVRVSTAPGQSYAAETVLVVNEEVTNVSRPGKYRLATVTTLPTNEPTSLNFRINNVTDTDAGRYLCRVVRLQDRKTHMEAEALLTVQHDGDDNTGGITNVVDKANSANAAYPCGFFLVAASFSALAGVLLEMVYTY